MNNFLVVMRLGDTPVLIPNTMVKTQAADGTILETVWESRWLPDSHGGIAQLGEHLPCKQGVKGSNPSISIACLVHADSMRTSEAQLPRSWHCVPMHLNL